MKTDKLIGAQLQSKRKELNIKQETATKQLNISRYALSRIENGKIKISMTLLIAYCQLLTVSLQDIIS